MSSSTTGAPISFNGLSSGLNTSEIISALLGVERAPITRLTDEQVTLEGQRTQLQSIQSSLTQLTFDAQELGSPTLFNTSQAVSSSEPTRIAATTTAGAAVGGYEVNRHPARELGAAHVHVQKPGCRRNADDRRQGNRSRGGREHRRSGQADQLGLHRNGVRSGGRKRNDGALHARNGRDGSGLHRGLGGVRSSNRRVSPKKARTRNTRSTGSREAPPRTSSPARSRE